MQRAPRSGAPCEAAARRSLRTPRAAAAGCLRAAVLLLCAPACVRSLPGEALSRMITAALQSTPVVQQLRDAGYFSAIPPDLSQNINFEATPVASSSSVVNQILGLVDAGTQQTFEQVPGAACCQPVRLACLLACLLRAQRAECSRSGRACHRRAAGAGESVRSCGNWCVHAHHDCLDDCVACAAVCPSHAPALTFGVCPMRA
jgi:hypothetical protein